jgi:hypothetical protein
MVRVVKFFSVHFYICTYVQFISFRDHAAQKILEMLLPQTESGRGHPRMPGLTYLRGEKDRLQYLPQQSEDEWKDSTLTSVSNSQLWNVGNVCLSYILRVDVKININCFSADVSPQPGYILSSHSSPEQVRREPMPAAVR